MFFARVPLLFNLHLSAPSLSVRLYASSEGCVYLLAELEELEEGRYTRVRALHVWDSKEIHDELEAWLHQLCNARGGACVMAAVCLPVAVAEDVKHVTCCRGCGHEEVLLKRLATCELLQQRRKAQQTHEPSLVCRKQDT